ncbi:Ribosomal protein S18 acetylase RimI [Halobacillus dabanensis]|uniref:Ribosomal protein S18 acetylase RimI n=1 Tax=Halobacillus dabanensis TaxID=240302 RepID=A0A1I3Z089_HALDA|nr:GNAT family N-acetyltransferase [Halobacillus dabanensis]SFK37527.1 Ribosomal protein S18 acetylase RimI [Halobacillus dabanensis]
MVKIREPEEKDLMHFTRYSIDFLHSIKTSRQRNEQLRDRKYWAADQLLANNPKQKLLVADMDGRMIGYVLGVIDQHGGPDEYGYVREVFVDEFYRREGIGTELFQQLMNWMHSQGVEAIQVNLDDYHNGISEFIRKSGFTPVSTLFEHKQKE